MDRVRPSAPQLAGLEPYDPKYLPARTLLSANENPLDVDARLRGEIMREVGALSFNRYPDPLANDLRDLIAQANGLAREQVLVGNGGDELLFNLALAWGGPGSTTLTFPPPFSVYTANARLTNTTVADVPRLPDFSADEDAVLARVAQGGIDYAVVTSPNNPTGNLAGEAFLERLLDATDALVVVDEAYFEFSGVTMAGALARHRNLCVLRTFSKAYSLAGVRMGYVLASAEVVRELVKVRQPYSVDAVSQAIARVVYANRAAFEAGVARIVSERERLFGGLGKLPGMTVFPSAANYLLVRMDAAAAPAPAPAGDAERAGRAWQWLYGRGVLVRDFSRTPLLEGCLRVSVGTPEENDALLAALRDFALNGE